MENKKMDTFLEERLNRYDKWLFEKKIAFSSKVVPIEKSLSAHQWVLPTEQVLEIFRNVKSIALTKCECRSHYKRCDNPLEVCFEFNEVGDQSVKKGLARHVSPEEAQEIVRVANEKGLVHLSLYMPDHELYALCSCCSCCCHDLQIVRLLGRNDLMVQSDYVAVTDDEACTHCGICIDRCVFDARTWQDDIVAYDPDACYGCGLCVTTCPSEAITMKRKNQTAR